MLTLHHASLHPTVTMRKPESGSSSLRSLDDDSAERLLSSLCSRDEDDSDRWCSTDTTYFESVDWCVSTTVCKPCSSRRASSMLAENQIDVDMAWVAVER